MPADTQPAGGGDQMACKCDDCISKTPQQDAGTFGEVVTPGYAISEAVVTQQPSPATTAT